MREGAVEVLWAAHVSRDFLVGKTREGSDPVSKVPTATQARCANHPITGEKAEDDAPQMGSGTSQASCFQDYIHLGSIDNR